MPLFGNPRGSVHNVNVAPYVAQTGGFDPLATGRTPLTPIKGFAYVANPLTSSDQGGTLARSNAPPGFGNAPHTR